MTCNDVINYIENWAPKEIAWKKDNVGLQVGNRSQNIKNIMLCLEVTGNVIEETIRKKCNMIISHHPLLFHPLNRIDTAEDYNSRLIEKLIKNDITLFSAHTNLDFTRDGISFELAKVLKLKNVKFLSTFQSNQFKIVVFVPKNFVAKAADAMFKAGGGSIGEYSNCSFQTEGNGTFRGSDKSNPSVGSKNVSEKVEEIKLEMVVSAANVKNVINAMLNVHPYEEPAYDLYPLANPDINYGAGAIGDMEESMNPAEFLSYITKCLKSTNLRFTKGKNKKIKKVAVCGGSGSELINDAIRKGADAFITADIKYHAFHEASTKILLIDAGHYETEIHSMNEVRKRLNSFVGKNSNTKIFKYSGSTNPVLSFNNQ
jgi:dinuclear metal center YbgI/SA1388 family protein